LIAALAAVLLLALAISGVVRLVKATVGIIATDGGEIGADPMFAEDAELATRPPELSEENGVLFQDNSANWDTSVQTPVDQTAAELGEEARYESHS
jgi:hypothetical protein